ncbi:SCO family protein [Cohnella lubricantis]|uniref:SCO family protein n=1 Tax=Cohnella lubricantis TaxID=2163172 RepID=A0A841TIG2_9BACL|nr:SCO family protein [Cohnella lubricantis]MBB6678271.1 SCO family protein [Cohnella lubricantis]MBP2118473.1 protein SCO1/2 [Cohnella lubricantis]
MSMQDEERTVGGAPVSSTGAAKKPFMKRYGFPMTLLALCVILAGFLIWNSMPKSEKLPDLGAAADFTYNDIDGNPVTFSDAEGKVRLVYFFFSNCPDVCPPTTYMLSQVQDKLKAEGKFGDKVEIFSITIDPVRDTPEALKTFAGKFNADFSGWKFLRGDEKETADLAYKYQLMVTKDEEGNFGHSNLIVLVDKKGRMREFISPASNGEAGEYDADGLVAEINSLL